MAATEDLEDRDWKDLAYLEESDREPVMKSRYEQLAELTEEERTSQLHSMEKALYDLPDDKIRSFTKSRLRVWLTLEPDVAEKTSVSFDVMVDLLPGLTAWRHIEVVQTMAREFSLREQARLLELFPRIFGARGSGMQAPAPAESPEETVSTPAKKPWWAFWKQ